MNNKIKIIILAAGAGTRMKSELPKALALLKGKPMVSYLIDKAVEITGEKPVVVVGHKKELVQEYLGDSVTYAIQEDQTGTAHAVLAAEDACRGVETIVVLSSDQPMVKSETIKKCIEMQRKKSAKIVFATTEVPNFEDWRKYFFSHGRILRQAENIIGILEYQDANQEELQILEVNTGCCYVFEGAWLWDNLRKIQNNNAKKEYYLVDLFELAHLSSFGVEAIKIDPREALGANSKEELELLENFDTIS